MTYHLTKSTAKLNDNPDAWVCYKCHISEAKEVHLVGGRHLYACCHSCAAQVLKIYRWTDRRDIFLMSVKNAKLLMIKEAL